MIGLRLSKFRSYYRYDPKKVIICVKDGAFMALYKKYYTVVGLTYWALTLIWTNFIVFLYDHREDFQGDEKIIESMFFPVTCFWHICIPLLRTAVLTEMKMFHSWHDSIWGVQKHAAGRSSFHTDALKEAFSKTQKERLDIRH